MMIILLSLTAATFRRHGTYYTMAFSPPSSSSLLSSSFAAKKTSFRNGIYSSSHHIVNKPYSSSNHFTIGYRSSTTTTTTTTTVTATSRPINDSSTTTTTTTTPPTTTTTTTTTTWAKRALLLSSFSDTITPPPTSSTRPSSSSSSLLTPTQKFLQSQLLATLLTERLLHTENAIKKSNRFSPCNGPSIDLLDRMQNIDAVVSHLSSSTDDDDDDDDDGVAAGVVDVKSLLDDDDDADDDDWNLRVLYIPTALYALRKDSKNTPGKQRQRARADGKQRRDEMVRVIGDLFRGVNVMAVTLDLDDGSVKQPYGSDDLSLFPKNGRDALSPTSWSPHLVYVEGGNTFWLHYCIEKGDWASSIVDACCSSSGGGVLGRNNRNPAVYCGKSAGAIIAGRRVDTACWKQMDDPSVVPGKERYEDWVGAKGLALAGESSFFPHMSEKWHDLIQENEDTIPNVVLLTDQDACFVVNGEERRSEVVNVNGSGRLVMSSSSSSKPR